MYGGLHRKLVPRVLMGNMGGQRLATLAVVVLLVGALSVTSIHPAPLHAATAVHPAATDSITVMATADYHYQPDTFQQVPTSATITVTFSDTDNLPHSFTISSREGFVVPTTYTPTQLDQLFTTYPPLFSSFVSGPGNQSVGTFQSPTTAGWYEFICNVTGHFQDGMYGFIAFGENLPSNLTPPVRVGLGGSNITPLQAASAGAVVLAIVLVFVVWRRRRSATKVPPGPPGSATTAPNEAPEVGEGRERGGG